MKKSKKKKDIEKNNTDVINQINDIEHTDLDKDLDQKLVDYLSLALRNTHYYGNLSIRYTNFNFTFSAFFASILAIFISFSGRDNFNYWYIGLPIIVGLVWYFIYFLVLLIANFNTVTFDHYNLPHYSCILDDIKDYPNITQNHLNNLLALIDKREEVKKLKQTNKEKPRKKLDLIKNDLKGLILQYLYQANYNRVSLIMRYCLIFGTTDLVLSIVASFFMYIYVDPNLFTNRIIVITFLIISILFSFCYIIKKSQLRLNAKKQI